VPVPVLVLVLNVPAAFAHSDLPAFGLHSMWVELLTWCVVLWSQGRVLRLEPHLLAWLPLQAPKQWSRL